MRPKKKQPVKGRGKGKAICSGLQLFDYFVAVALTFVFTRKSLGSVDLTHNEVGTIDRYDAVLCIVS